MALGPCPRNTPWQHRSFPDPGRVPFPPLGSGALVGDLPRATAALTNTFWFLAPCLRPPGSRPGGTAHRLARQRQRLLGWRQAPYSLSICPGSMERRTQFPDGLEKKDSCSWMSALKYHVLRPLLGPFWAQRHRLARPVLTPGPTTPVSIPILPGASVCSRLFGPLATHFSLAQQTPRPTAGTVGNTVVHRLGGWPFLPHRRVGVWLGGAQSRG